MLRTFGKTMGQVRRMSNDFKRQFDEALREAEREAGSGRHKEAAAGGDEAARRMRKDFDATVRAAESHSPAGASSPMPDKPDAMPHIAEPAKTGAPTPAHGSDAA